MGRPGGAHAVVSRGQGNPSEPQLWPTLGDHSRPGSGSRALGDRHGLRPAGSAESIPQLIAKASEGYDIVFARRKSRQDSVIRRLGARAYFWALGVFFGSRMDGEYGTFSIISRKVIDAYLELRDADRHYLFILRWLGFESSSIDVEHAARPTRSQLIHTRETVPARYRRSRLSDHAAPPLDRVPRLPRRPCRARSRVLLRLLMDGS